LKPTSVKPATIARLLAAGLAAAALFGPGDGAAEQLRRNQERSVRLGRLVEGVLPPDGVLLIGLGHERWSVQAGPAEARYFVDHVGWRADVEYGWRPWLRAWATAPWRSWSGGAGDLPAAASGLADGEAGLVLGLPRPWRDAGFALDLRTTLPLGSRASGLGDGAAAPYAGLAWTQRFWRDAQVPELRLHAAAGRRWTPRDEGRGVVGGGRYEPWPLTYPADVGGVGNDPWQWGVGVDLRKSLAVLHVTYAAEAYPASAAIAAREAYRALAAGVRWGAEDGWALDVAYEVPLSREDLSTPFTASVPDWTVAVGVSRGFAVGGTDRDRDGITDRLDLCPDAPEDRDGFRDEDGCPDPDNDEDGVPDTADAAPDVAEDPDGWRDQDGAPDPDNDGDGILDQQDHCPFEAENYNGYQDTDGCPDEMADRDGDGIEDREDRCADVAEDRDGFEDEDGCPDPDNDLDGILDARDGCPDQAEDYDGELDDDGCPEATDAPAVPDAPGGAG